jgi:hypothetical protein
MHHSHSPPTPTGILYTISEEHLKRIEEIYQKQDQILHLLKKITTPDPLQGYISEDDARARFKRGTTWFWTKRQEGLQSIKVGATNYYLVEDLIKFFGAE